MSLQSTDPEYTQRLGAFLEEVRNEPDSMLEPTTRWLAILAIPALVWRFAPGPVRLNLRATVLWLPWYLLACTLLATDYLGYGRALPFLHATNDALTAAGIALPLPGQATTTMNDRLEKGIAAQVKIFGDHMNEAWKAGTVNRYLAANCFGDYYTRTGLDLAQREMITLCFRSAQGGCEPQLIAHAKGNMNMGNDAAFLTKVVLQCLPYIGYPRSLNAMGCIAKAAKQ